MLSVSVLKKERKARLAENKSRSHKIINNITKQTRKLQNDLISDTVLSTDNEYFTYKNYPCVFNQKNWVTRQMSCRQLSPDG